MVRKKAVVSDIIFDCDNTAVDFAYMKFMCTVAAVDGMVACGLNVEREQAIRKIFEIYERHKNWEHPKIFQDYLDEVFPGYECSSGGVDLKANFLSSAITNYRKEKANSLFAYDGVHSVLKKLNEEGYKLHVLTDAPKQKVYDRLNATGLMFIRYDPTSPLFAASKNPVFYFKNIASPDDTGYKKPAIEHFKFLIDKIDAPASQIMFVGDNIAKDLEPAKELGMVTSLAVYGARSYPHNQLDDSLKKIMGDISGVQAETISRIEAGDLLAVDYTLRSIVDLLQIIRLPS